LRKFSEPPQLLTYDQVGQQLGQSRTAVYGLVREGRLPVVHLGRWARIPRVAVEAFVSELVAEAESKSAPLDPRHGESAARDNVLRPFPREHDPVGQLGAR